MSNGCSCVGVRRCPEFVQSPGSDNPLGSRHLHLGLVLVPAVHVHLQVLVNITNVIINHGGGGSLTVQRKGKQIGKVRLCLWPDLGLLGHCHPVDLRVFVPPAEGVEHVEEGHRHVDEDYQRKQRVCNVKLL